MSADNRNVKIQKMPIPEYWDIVFGGAEHYTSLEGIAEWV